MNNTNIINIKNGEGLFALPFLDSWFRMIVCNQINLNQHEQYYGGHNSICNLIVSLN
jgi:hypothetical protein